MIYLIKDTFSGFLECPLYTGFIVYIKKADVDNIYVSVDFHHPMNFLESTRLITSKFVFAVDTSP
jgi:hypothetical protein